MITDLGNGVYLLDTQMFRIIVPSDPDSFHVVEYDDLMDGFLFLKKINDYIMNKNPNLVKILIMVKTIKARSRTVLFKWKKISSFMMI